MQHLTLTFFILFSLLAGFLVFSALRTFLRVHKKKIEAEEKSSSEVEFVVDTFHDLVSKLKEKEKELEALRSLAEERASSIELYNEDILQSVPSGVVSFDRELKITKVNSAARKILDFGAEDVAGSPYDLIFEKPLGDILKKGETVERAEVGYTTRSGKRIWLGLNLSPLKDSSDNRIGQILVFTDLTELRAFQSQVELRERLSTLGEMSAGIAHELRNPLGVISGYTKILLRKVEGAAVPAVEAIAGEVAVMDRIISDFLSFARPKELLMSEVDLNELIKGCVEAAVDAEGVQITIDGGVIPVIMGDEVLLRQSITNLLQNAVEATPDGGTVRISSSMNESVSISISDTGHGIPENIRDKVFLPFFTTKERGTGLGLSLVHKIIVSHGGDIFLESGENGTTFTIRLPIPAHGQR